MVSIMIPLNPVNFHCQGMKIPDQPLKGLWILAGTMYQVTKNEKLFNLKLFDQFHQAFMILLVRLIAEGNPLSLHELGFSQVDVRHQHGIQVREEEDPLRMKADFLTMQGCF